MITSVTPCMFCLTGILRWQDFTEAPLCIVHRVILTDDEMELVQSAFVEERRLEVLRGDCYNGKPVTSMLVPILERCNNYLYDLMRNL